MTSQERAARQAAIEAELNELIAGAPGLVRFLFAALESCPAPSSPEAARAWGQALDTGRLYFAELERLRAEETALAAAEVFDPPATPAPELTPELPPEKPVELPATDPGGSSAEPT